MKSSAATTRAQWVMAGWSTAAESSAAATGAQWAAAELSVAAGWSAAEYRSGNFEKSEREREISIRIGSVNFELDTKVPDWAPGVRKGGGRGLPHPSPQAKVINC